MRWRYLAQNVLTGQFIHTDLPLQVESLSWELSGPGALNATVPSTARSALPPLEPWQTALYAEADDEIRWGGILQNKGIQGAAFKLDFAGFTSYPTRIPYVGAYYKKIDYDPTAIFIELWQHLQAQPDGDLGVEVIRSAKCPVRVGTKDEPFELRPEEAPDIGEELATLAQETPFDYVEHHAWDGESVAHTVTIGYPRVGRKREDLAFIEGDNVTGVTPVQINGEAFANTIYALGLGEGASMVRAEIAQRDGRLRRPYVFTDKTVKTKSRLTALARKQFRYRAMLPDISGISVKQHPNAPIGSWQVGDDILVKATVNWEDVAIWCRIVAWSMDSPTTATLTLVRSDMFSYGPNYVEEVVELPPVEEPPVLATSLYGGYLGTGYLA